MQEFRYVVVAIQYLNFINPDKNNMRSITGKIRAVPRSDPALTSLL